MKIRTIAAAVVCTGACALGLATPAVAEGHFSSWMSAWSAGDESRQWVDANNDNTNGYAQFSKCSANDFLIKIYKEDFGPDTVVGSEKMQCLTGSSQTLDRVYEGDVGKDEYHFTLKSSVPGGLYVHDVYVQY